ncbi:MAG: HAD family phosphatase [Cellulosilyticum sp.]|nr:HAD family phosphatase [Cellulosilyticum sp.]
MNYKQIEAVIFDLDGTLIDSMWVWNKIDIDFLAKRNIEVPADLDKDIEGMSFTDTAQYFKERFKLDMSIEEIKTEWSQMAWEFYTKKIELKKGVRAFLEILKERNIKMGIATSNNVQLVEAILESQGIKPYFIQVRTSCEVGRGKPFPDIYLKVAEDLGVEPDNCLVFEDIPNGVRAGKNAGMITWGIRDRQDDSVWEEVKEISDDQVEDYFEAIEKLGVDLSNKL